MFMLDAKTDARDSGWALQRLRRPPPRPDGSEKSTDAGASDNIGAPAGRIREWEDGGTYPDPVLASALADDE